MIHDAVHNTSAFEEFYDSTTGFTRQIYACPNLDAPLKITDTDLKHSDLDARTRRGQRCIRTRVRVDAGSALDSLTTLKLDPRAAGRGRARRYASAISSELRSSAGRTASSSRVRCATEECWSAGEQLQAFGVLSRGPRAPELRYAQTAQRTSPARPATRTRNLHGNDYGRR